MRGIIASLIVLVPALALLGCGGRSGARTPSATSFAAASVASAPRSTGIAELDAIIRATLEGDNDALAASLGYTRMGCVVPQQEGSPPGCLPGEPPGTVVDAFLVMGCGGTYERSADAERIVRGSRTPARLYAAGSPAAKSFIDGTQYLLVFSDDQGSTPDGFSWYIRDGKIIGYAQTCTTVADEARLIGRFLVPPRGGS